MIRINLLPVRQLKRRAQARDQLMGFLMVLVAVLVVMGLISLRLNSRIEVAQGKLNDLQAEQSRLAPIIKEVDKLEQQQKELSRKIQVIKDLRKDSSLTVRVLDEVANSVDNKRMWLDSLSQKGGSLELKGIALDNETIAQFMETLKKSPFIQSVSLASSTVKKVGERSFKSFSLSCSIGFPEETKDKNVAQK